MSYISHEDYKSLMDKFQKETPKSMLKEGNAFTAALAKTKKGGKAKVDGQEVTDTSNYDDPSVKEYGYADNYPGSWGYKEGMDHPGEAERTHIENIAGRMKDMGMDAESIYDALVGEYDVDGMVADIVVDGLFGKKEEGLNPAPLQATGPTISVTEDKLNVQSPEEVAEFVAAKHPELALKLGAERENAALKHAYEIILKTSGEVVARNLINGLSNEDWPSDYLQALKSALGKKEEGLNPAPMQATGQSIEEYHMDKPFKLPKRTDTSRLDYDPAASRFEPDYMKTAGEEEDEDDKEGNIDPEFEFNDIISASDDIPKTFKKAVARDRDRYPFLREDSVANPPYGFSALPTDTRQQLQTSGLKRLSPDETKQLQEYIESVKTIKKEIAKLAAKAGKKIKEGGDTTGLTMPVSETKMDPEKYERIEGLMDMKLHDAFEKVTGMIVKDLKEEGFDDDDITQYLKYEIEKKAKEAVMGQHDIAEAGPIIPKNAKPAHTLKPGDIIGSGEKIVKVWPGAKMMSGKLDMNKVTVELEKPDGAKRVGIWGKNTPIPVKG